MKKYIFNEEYFQNGFMNGESIKYKLPEIANIIEYSVEYTGDKRRNHNNRRFNYGDYDRLKEKEPLLLLNTEKLLYKFFKRVNRDMIPNEKYMVFIMLCEYDKRKIKDKWISFDEIDEKYELISRKAKKILDSSEIFVDEKGKKEKMFLKNDEGLYTINISAFIKYSELEN